MRLFSLVALFAVAACSGTDDADDNTEADADADTDADADADADVDTDLEEPGDPVEPIDTYVFDWGSDAPDTGFVEPEEGTDVPPVVPGLTACVVDDAPLPTFTDPDLFDAFFNDDKSLPTGDDGGEWSWNGLDELGISHVMTFQGCAEPGDTISGYLTVGLVNEDGEYWCSYRAPIQWSAPESDCADCDAAYAMTFAATEYGGEWIQCLDLISNPTEPGDMFGVGFSTDPVQAYTSYLNWSYSEPWYPLEVSGAATLDVWAEARSGGQLDVGFTQTSPFYPWN